MSSCQDSVSIYDQISSWSTFASSVVALLAFLISCKALYYVYKQYESSKDEARRAIAYQVYSDYLKMSKDDKNFSSADSALGNFGMYPEEYKWHVAFMLFSFEQIYFQVGNQVDWKSTLRSQLKRHALYLMGSSSFHRGDWSQDFKDFICDLIDEELSKGSLIEKAGKRIENLRVNSKCDSQKERDERESNLIQSYLSDFSSRKGAMKNI